ncbi:hypothetical protein B0A48_18352 [Cryoendolithus antarcticus]|uniref:hydroxymethylglutaryl-CoA lyase n=1 Tax=Cryoendolithus antarcticus TaxID=1507870 RepID=A0A1V8SAD9_9PEZI|nr:hypothetical protein B0A48_18352 [Cryoendolithus antarcticus]
MSDEYVKSIVQSRNVRAPVLVSNVKGLEVARGYGIKEVAVFVSASEAFSRANINCSTQQGLDRARHVAKSAKQHGIAIRGYISCIFACPFDGPIPHAAVLNCVQQLLAIGCYEISLGDTVGVGVPADVSELANYLTNAGVPVEFPAGHFHDTYGQAISNVWAAYQCGIRVFDSSAGGMGGCPYTPGARGNLATEDLVYSLHQSGRSTGIDLTRLVRVGEWISQVLSAPNSSRAGSAIALKSAAKVSPESIPSVAKLKWSFQPSMPGLEILRSGTNLQITLDLPKNGNALIAVLIAAITSMFVDAAQDPNITRIVLSARGKYFCTSMDLSRDSPPVAKSESATDAQYARVTKLSNVIDNAPQVTIALAKGSSMTLSEGKLGLAPATISR